MPRVYNAAFCSSQELLRELEKVYLLGQSQKKILTEAIEYAVESHHICAIENLYKVGVNRVRHLNQEDMDVNAIRPNMISLAIRNERTDVDVLRLFLDLGLDLRKVFGNQGDALMWAVRIGRWELIERILNQKGSFNVDEVKVGQLYHSVCPISQLTRATDAFTVPQIRQSLYPSRRCVGPNPHSRRTPPLWRPRHGRNPHLG
jgi:hypothetical protein